ncbi:extracellular protein [Lactiplantibacillus plantarum]|nr:extracellular protein [Lactiplantibacillus plantarum]
MTKRTSFKFRWVALVATLIFGIGGWQLLAHADSSSDEPIVTLGSSLTSSQKTGTINTLTASLNGADYQTLTVNGDTLVKYLNPAGESFTSSSGVWSSAMIQKTSSGSGINVKILDYNGSNNITTITANQYKNAALTAGITDANIYVTSATPIDGSGALAGVYAAYAKSGNSLNTKQVTAAQDELSTLSGITQANKNKDGYTDSQLNNAIAGAKKEMAQKGSSVTKNEITTIVNQQITNNNLTNVITNNQKTEIINLLVKIRDSGALDSSSFKTQANSLMKNIQSNAKNVFSKLNTKENQNLLQKIWTAIVNFFSSIFKSIFG